MCLCHMLPAWTSSFIDKRTPSLSRLVTVIMALRKFKYLPRFHCLGTHRSGQYNWEGSICYLTLRNTRIPLGVVPRVTTARQNHPFVLGRFFELPIFLCRRVGMVGSNKSSGDACDRCKRVSEFVNGFVLVGVALPVERSSLIAISYHRCWWR